jgi:putative ATP-dependent endonuclease of the OLD family
LVIQNAFCAALLFTQDMFVESFSLTNFRCFGPDTQRISLSSGLTAFIGANGSGKTAVMNALLRLFGVTSEQRRMRRQDFHVPATEEEVPVHRELAIEAILAFPELDAEDGDHSAVPEFFHQMATDDNGHLKCRLRMQATWTDDGSLEGAIEQKYWAVRTLGTFEQKDCVELKQIDRARIQMLYVPASRDAVSQVGAFLRSRLWRAITWSQQVRDAFAEAGNNLNDTFSSEIAVDLISQSLEKRWAEVHSAGTDAKPKFRPIDPRFQEFIRKVEVVFHPDEFGQDRGLQDLSDGQRSLFHLAMTATTLDIEDKIVQNQATGFQADSIHIPTLTLIAIEEPENSLAPFYLSRIIRQLDDLTRN